MVFFNYALRKLNAKIVYYGPGLCGKTTNLQWIHDHFEGGQRGKMISLATEGDRTIFFDLLPIEIGTIRGMDENILVAPYMVRGGTDSKYFYAVSPNVYRFMMIRVDPETIKYVHGIDEHVAVEDYLEAIRFYYHLVRQSMGAGGKQ